jgi:hypothetical protein
MLVILDQLFNDAQRTSDIILAFEEWYKDTRYHVYKVLILNYFWEEAAMKILEEVKLVSFLFLESDCVSSIGWVQLRTTFFVKKNGPIKPGLFYFTCDCYHISQHNLDKTTAWMTGFDPQHGPRYFLIAAISKLAVDPSEPSIKWALG